MVPPDGRGDGGREWCSIVPAAASELLFRCLVIDLVDFLLEVFVHRGRGFLRLGDLLLGRRRFPGLLPAHPPRPPRPEVSWKSNRLMRRFFGS
jgi:hypothetical protein